MANQSYTIDESQLNAMLFLAYREGISHSLKFNDVDPDDIKNEVCKLRELLGDSLLSPKQPITHNMQEDIDDKCLWTF